MEFCGTGHKNESYHSLLILEYIGLVGYQEKFLLGKSSQTLAQAARGLMESPGGSRFQKHGDVALREEHGWGHGQGRWGLGGWTR